MKKEYSTKKLYKMDRETIVNLVEEYRFSLLWFVLGFVKNIDDAEDVVSDVIVKLLCKEPNIKSELAMKTYLFATAKNIALNYLRKYKNIINMDMSNLSFDKEIIEQAICKNEEQEQLLKAISKINIEYKEVIYLHYFQDLHIAEIAKILKKNKKQIYNQLNRGKNALKKILEEEKVIDEDN